MTICLLYDKTTDTFRYLLFLLEAVLNIYNSNLVLNQVYWTFTAVLAHSPQYNAEGTFIGRSADTITNMPANLRAKFNCKPAK